MKKFYLPLSLQLFADAQESADMQAPEFSGDEDAVDAEQQESTDEVSEVDSSDLERENARRAEFERLIKEEYKDLFTEKTQSIINKRFKKAKISEQRLEEVEPLLDVLADRYNLDSADISSLTNAAREDDAFISRRAEELNMSREQYDLFRALENENRKLRLSNEQRDREFYANAVYSQWMEQAQQTKDEYPDFDLEVESEDENFVTLLKSGIPVKTAYEVIHRDKIISDAVNSAKQSVLNEIKTSSMRHSDGDITGAGFVSKNDIEHLTTSQMEDIERRVLRGEKITF